MITERLISATANRLSSCRLGRLGFVVLFWLQIR